MSKITPTIGRTIRAAHAKGASSAIIAAAVLSKHGLKLDRASVTRWLARENAPKAAPSAIPGASGELAAPGDEVAVLERQALALRGALADDLTPSNRARLVAELRHVLRQIREVKASAKPRSRASADVSELRAQLMVSFAPTLGTYVAPPSSEARPPDAEATAEAAIETLG